MFVVVSTALLWSCVVLVLVVLLGTRPQASGLLALQRSDVCFASVCVSGLASPCQTRKFAVFIWFCECGSCNFPGRAVEYRLVLLNYNT